MGKSTHKEQSGRIQEESKSKEEAYVSVVLGSPTYQDCSKFTCRRERLILHIIISCITSTMNKTTKHNKK